MISLFRTIAGVLVGGILARGLGLFARLSGSSAAKKEVTRRNFVRNASIGASAVILAEMGAGFVRFFWPNKTGAFGSTLTVAASDVPEVGGVPFTYSPGKFYLVQNEDGLLAIYWKCTHLGCTVPWNASEDRFHCPCHGSIFFKNGIKESGPAPVPLNLFAITVLPTGDVEVNTGEIIARSEYEPSQAVPYIV